MRIQQSIIVQLHIIVALSLTDRQRLCMVRIGVFADNLLI